jgi:hypothetical protein
MICLVVAIGMKKIVTDDHEYTHLDFLSYMIFAYNDLYNTWVPNLSDFPMFMFHSSTDEAVLVENLRTARLL